MQLRWSATFLRSISCQPSEMEPFLNSIYYILMNVWAMSVWHMLCGDRNHRESNMHLQHTFLTQNSLENQIDTYKSWIHVVSFQETNVHWVCARTLGFGKKSKKKTKTKTIMLCPSEWSDCCLIFACHAVQCAHNKNEN